MGDIENMSEGEHRRWEALHEAGRPPTDITPERMSEERLAHLHGWATESDSTYIVHEASSLQYLLQEALAHIAWQAGENADLRDDLAATKEIMRGYNLSLTASVADMRRMTAERDAAEAECERLATRERDSQRMFLKAVHDSTEQAAEIARLRERLQDCVTSWDHTSALDEYPIQGAIDKARVYLAALEGKTP